MKMIVLGDKEVEIITPEEMLKKFGSNIAYAPKNGIVYINQEFLDGEKEKFGKYLTTEEIVEDIFIEARWFTETGSKTQKWRYTLWKELLRRHIDPKYRREPIIV